MQTHCYIIKPVTERDVKSIRSVIVGHQIHAKSAALKDAGSLYMEVVVAEPNEMSRIVELAALISGRKVAYKERRF